VENQGKDPNRRGTNFIYLFLVRQKFTYGSTIWYKRIKHGELVNKKRRLKTLQNQTLKNITKVFKKVNTKTLKAEIYIPLIHIVFNKF